MNSNPENTIVLANGRVATHYCNVCGALWQQGNDYWSLVSLSAGSCCDNATMAGQIQPIPAVPLA